MELPYQLKNMVNPKSGWLKLAETGRFLAQIARNPARKNTLKYCVFTIFSLRADWKILQNQCVAVQFAISRSKVRIGWGYSGAEKCPLLVKMCILRGARGGAATAYRREVPV
jgi:hypothetical protein